MLEKAARATEEEPPSVETALLLERVVVVPCLVPESLMLRPGVALHPGQA